MKHLWKKKDGYALIWVLCVFLLVAVFSAVLVTATSLTVNSTKISYDGQQSYFTAKSAAESVAGYVMKNADNPSAIEALLNQTGSGSAAQMGAYQVQVTYLADGRLQITADADYNGQKSRVTVYLTQNGGPGTDPSGNVPLPTDHVFYINGSAVSGFLPQYVTGDVYVDGSLSLGSNSVVDGNILVRGDTSLAGAGISTKNLTSFGNVSINGSGNVNGDVISYKGFDLQGGGKVQGNVYAMDYVNIPNGKVYGNVVSDSGFELDGGGTVGGSVYAQQEVNIKNGLVSKDVITNSIFTLAGGQVTDNVYAKGNVSLQNGTVYGNIYTNGNVDICKSWPTINANIFADGSLSLEGNVTKSVTIGKDLTVKGGKIKNLTYYGIINPLPYGSITDFVSGTISKPAAAYTPIDLTALTNSLTSDLIHLPTTSLPGALPLIYAPAISQQAVLDVPTKTFTAGGIIDSGIINTLNDSSKFSYNSVVTIDATSADIEFLLRNTNFTPSGGLRFNIIGTHNVYFYLEGNSSIQLNGDNRTYFGMIDPNAKPQLFIIGDDQKISISNARLEAVIYVPNGTFTATGGSVSGYDYIFKGCCIVKSANVNSLRFQYKVPDFAGTPLENLRPGTSGGTPSEPPDHITAGAWAIESWR